MAEIEHPPIPIGRQSMPLGGPASQPRSQNATGRNTPITGGHNAEEAIIITSSDEEDEPPIVPRRLHPRPNITEQRTRLRHNRNGTPIVPHVHEDRLRIMSPPPPLPQIPPFMFHEPGHIHERRRNPLVGTLPLAPGAQDGMMPNLHGFLRAERLQLLNLLQHPRYADFGSFMDYVGFRERHPAGPPASPPEYDVRMTHASAKPRIGYTFDFEIEPEAPVEPAVRTRTTIIIPDSPPARPVDYKGKGKAKQEDLDEIDLNGDPNAPIELVSSPAAGSSSSSSRPKKKQQQRRAVEIVEFLSDDESDEGATGSPSNSQPVAHQGLQNVLVCASCRRPLRTGGGRLWALRCGHMIDSRCYHKFSEQPLEEQGPSTFDLVPSTSTAPPRPQRPSKRRKTERKSGSKPTTPQVVQTYQWKCPASGCGRVHTSERVVMNDETSWRPAQADGAIKVFI